MNLQEFKQELRNVSDNTLDAAIDSFFECAGRLPFLQTLSENQDPPSQEDRRFSESLHRFRPLPGRAPLKNRANGPRGPFALAVIPQALTL